MIAAETVVPLHIAPWPVIGIRIGFIALGIIAWYVTQAALAHRAPKVAYEVPLTDGLHVLTRRIHHRYGTNVAAGNRLLIISSLVIDLLGVYLLGAAIFGSSIRPYLGLVMVFALRQVCQMLCPLPAPAGMVWRYPGVPAILVTYGTANDLFFSGHTAIAVYGAATLAGHWGAWGLALGIAIAIFEAVTVLVLRAHYTMDVFTGTICALWVYSLNGQLAPWGSTARSAIGSAEPCSDLARPVRVTLRDTMWRAAPRSLPIPPSAARRGIAYSAGNMRNDASRRDLSRPAQGAIAFRA